MNTKNKHKEINTSFCKIKRKYLNFFFYCYDTQFAHTHINPYTLHTKRVIDSSSVDEMETL